MKRNKFKIICPVAFLFAMLLTVMLPLCAAAAGESDGGSQSATEPDDNSGAGAISPEQKLTEATQETSHDITSNEENSFNNGEHSGENDNAESESTTDESHAAVEGSTAEGNASAEGIPEEDTAVIEGVISEDITVIEGVTAEDNSVNSAKTEKANIFQSIYESALTNADKIFALLAFLGTVIVSFAYKKGLIPVISGGIEKIGSAISGWRKEIDGAREEDKEGISKIRDGLASLENASTILAEELTLLNDKLNSSLDTKEENEKTRLILSAQIDMLYDIFMSSALPHFEKEEIGRRVSKMREELIKLDKQKS